MPNQQHAAPAATTFHAERRPGAGTFVAGKMAIGNRQSTQRDKRHTGNAALQYDVWSTRPLKTKAPLITQDYGLIGTILDANRSTQQLYAAQFLRLEASH